MFLFCFHQPPLKSKAVQSYAGFLYYPNFFRQKCVFPQNYVSNTYFDLGSHAFCIFTAVKVNIFIVICQRHSAFFRMFAKVL